MKCVVLFSLARFYSLAENPFCVWFCIYAYYNEIGVSSPQRMWRLNFKYIKSHDCCWTSNASSSRTPKDNALSKKKTTCIVHICVFYMRQIRSHVSLISNSKDYFVHKTKSANYDWCKKVSFLSIPPFDTLSRLFSNLASFLMPDIFLFTEWL